MILIGHRAIERSCTNVSRDVIPSAEHDGGAAMKLGIYLNSQHPAGDDPARRFDEMLEQVRLIRSLGFDSIWAGEHHITPGFHFFPQLPLLHRLAGEAEGLWIGTNVTLLPLHNPVELAEEGAFLDVITGGRFLLGVGLGYRPEEYQIYGVPMSERVSRFTEAVTGGCTCPPGLPCVCGAVPRARLVWRGAHRPGPAELSANPRSESARLRAAEKLEIPT